MNTGGSTVDSDGYELWLRYSPLSAAEAERLTRLDPFMMTPIDVHGVLPRSPTMDAARDEITRGLLRLASFAASRDHNGARGQVLLTCPEDRGDGNVAFAIRSDGDDISISGTSDLACLYGTYALLRELSLGADPRTINLTSAPAMPLRLLNHWDNPDGHVERGYAGRSIFDWWHLPERLDQRMIDYARANASIGINGVVVNNVNASAMMLEPRYYRPAGAARRCVAALWHPRLSLRAVQCPARYRRAGDGRSARPGGGGMVAGQGGRDLRGDSRFRRLSGQGQFRRPARPAGLWPHPCRRGEHDGRCRGRPGHGDLARFRLFGRGRDRPRHAKPTPNSCRSTGSSPTT